MKPQVGQTVQFLTAGLGPQAMVITAVREEEDGSSLVMGHVYWTAGSRRADVGPILEGDEPGNWRRIPDDPTDASGIYRALKNAADGRTEWDVFVGQVMGAAVTDSDDTEREPQEVGAEDVGDAGDVLGTDADGADAAAE